MQIPDKSKLVKNYSGLEIGLAMQQVRGKNTSDVIGDKEYLGREHLKGKFHFSVDLLFDRFRNVLLCSINFSSPSAKNISKLVKQEVNRTVILPP